MWIPGKNLAFIFETTSSTVGLFDFAICIIIISFAAFIFEITSSTVGFFDHLQKKWPNQFYKKVFQGDFSPAPVVPYFNSKIKTVMNDRYFNFIEDSFEELISKIDQWTRMDNR